MTTLDNNRVTDSTDTKEPVSLVCASDDNYALSTAVMLRSVTSHADPSRPVTVFLVDHGISRKYRERIESVIGGSLALQWLEPRAELEDIDPGWGHVSAATYDRLLLPRLLARTSGKVLWLDSDLLVVDDICRLFDKPMSSRSVSAVRDPLVETLGSRFGVQALRQLGLPPNQPYFNAGVLLVDLSGWVAREVTERALDYLHRYTDRVFFHDQEALNAVLWDDWLPLEDRWNCLFNRVHRRDQNTTPGDAGILHFAGRMKPWAQPGLGEFQERWFEYLDQTGWRGARPNGSLARRLLGVYLNSPLRALTYPLENDILWLQHRLKMRRR